MKAITVKTQEEFDKANRQKTPCQIFIESEQTLTITITETIHHVVARGSSHVVARGSSHVEARGSSHVVAWESSHVVAWESSHVVARGSSHVEARGSSHVVAWESSHVVAWESSHVVARGSSHVATTARTVTIELYHHSVAILTACAPDITEHGDKVTVVRREMFLHTTTTFLECYAEQINDDGRVELFKSVREEGTDFYSGTIKYEGVVECPDWDPDPERQCGGGLHLSPTSELALSYNYGKLKRCLVHPDDIVVYGSDISKVRCRKVEVVGDYDGQ
jgi:hypothetical protein